MCGDNLQSTCLVVDKQAMLIRKGGRKKEIFFRHIISTNLKSNAHRRLRFKVCTDVESVIEMELSKKCQPSKDRLMGTITINYANSKIVSTESSSSSAARIISRMENNSIQSENNNSYHTQLFLAGINYKLC